MALKIGSLFSGYAGLDLAAQSVMDSETAWFCEIESAPSKILAYHYPTTPNLGDITAVNWEVIAKEAPVDILTGGFP